MNRKYTTEEFEKSVQLLRKIYPNLALTTDIIVGFPGETENEFSMTYEFLKRIQFYKMHIFKYSKRKGTRAATMPNQIDGNIMEERSRKLIELSNCNQKQQNEQYIGKEVYVLFEEKDGKYCKGHTSNYIVVWVTYETGLENQLKKVRIEKATETEIYGSIVNKN